MANPKRKMCTMRRVSAVTPIDGADRIEAVHVDGWVVVDQKGIWHDGDLCVYYEPDTAMPTNDDRYKHMAQWGEKNMEIKGVPKVVHVLKTRRLRGVYSQGYIAKPQDVLPESIPEYAYEKMFERKACLDGIAGVCEYHPLENRVQMGFIGKYDPYVAPRTDAERIQNIDQETFDLVKRCGYYSSVKVDGTSITMVTDPRKNAWRAFSHNNEFDLGEHLGRTVAEVAERQGLREFCDAFPGISLQAELCGPKIGGNTLKLSEYRLFVFSAWSMEDREYLIPDAIDGHESVVHVRESSVPYVDDSTGCDFLDQFATPNDFLEYVNGMRGHVTPGCLDEGVVVHILDFGDLDSEEQMKLRNALGDTLQVKAVSNAFLLKKAR